jgi:FtsH-binding integral membrane protein
MRAQTLSDAADSKSALAPLLYGCGLVQNLKPENDEHPDREPPVLDGVGITPQPELSDFEPAPPLPQAPLDSPTEGNVQRLFVRAYALVSAALLLSAAIATQVPATREEDLLSNQVTLQFLFFFEIACVAVLSRYVPKLPGVWAAIVLFVCAAVNGASFTAFFAWIPATAVAYGFLLSGLSFGATAAIARWRHIDLSAPRGIFTLFSVGLGLIATTTFGLRLDVDYWGTSITAFVIFAALASYYCDDISDLDLEFDDDLSGWKSAVCGALLLYLNFINLYLLAVRLITFSFSNSEKRKRGLWL